MKSLLVILLILTVLTSCKHQKSRSSQVIATTSWTAAYAMAAGAGNVYVLAPYEMIHPSEYELRPGDIERLNSASLIVYAGYEVMARQIQVGLNIPDENMMKINTSYKYAEIEAAVMMIAKRLGSESTAKKNLLEIKQLFDNGKIAVHKSGLDTKTVLVHFFQESFAEELGINTTMVFGPAPPEPKQILYLSRTNAALMIDNAHNPVGGAVREILKNGEYKQLLNFPGLNKTRTIADVIRYNIDQVIAK